MLSFPNLNLLFFTPGKKKQQQKRKILFDVNKIYKIFLNINKNFELKNSHKISYCALSLIYEIVFQKTNYDYPLFSITFNLFE